MYMHSTHAGCGTIVNFMVLTSCDDSGAQRREECVWGLAKTCMTMHVHSLEGTLIASVSMKLLQH